MKQEAKLRQMITSSVSSSKDARNRIRLPADDVRCCFASVCTGKCSSSGSNTFYYYSFGGKRFFQPTWKYFFYLFLKAASTEGTEEQRKPSRDIDSLHWRPLGQLQADVYPLGRYIPWTKLVCLWPVQCCCCCCCRRHEKEKEEERKRVFQIIRAQIPKELFTEREWQKVQPKENAAMLQETGKWVNGRQKKKLKKKEKKAKANRLSKETARVSSLRQFSCIKSVEPQWLLLLLLLR